MPWRVPNLKFHSIDSAGAPLSGGLLYTYEIGTTTAKPTYPTAADALAETNALSNPIELDSRGEKTIYANGDMKFVLKDSDGVTIWTEDNVNQDSFFQSDYKLSWFSANDADPEVPLDAHSRFYNAIDGIGATVATLFIDTSDTIVENVSVPSNIRLKFLNGKTLDGAYTLTLDSPNQIEAGALQKIFGSSITISSTYDGKGHPGWYGGLPDGSTDCGAIINKVLVAFGYAELHEGTYIMEVPAAINSLDSLIGPGPLKTTLKVKNAVNDQAIETINFDTLSGYDGGAYSNTWLTSGGNIHGFHLEGFAIDGNKANQSTGGDGMRLYGKRFILKNIMIFDCYDVGLLTECAEAGGQTDETDMPECSIGPLWIRNCGGEGWINHGPHDGHFGEVYIASCGLNGYTAESSTNEYDGKMTGDSMHVYSCNSSGGTAGVLLSRSNDILSVETESNQLEGIRVTGDNTQIGMLKMYSNQKQYSGGGALNTKYHLNIDGAAENTRINTIHLLCDYGCAGIYDAGTGSQLNNVYVAGGDTGGIGIIAVGGRGSIRGRVENFSATGGEGLVLGNDADDVNDYMIDLAIQACKTGFESKFSSGAHLRNMLRLRIFTAAGEAAVSGEAPTDTTEDWNIIATGASAGKTRNEVLSADTIDLTSTTEQSINIAHGLLWAPTVYQCQVSLQKGAGLSGIIWGYLSVSACDATNVTIKLKLETGLGSGTASLVLMAKC